MVFAIRSRCVGGWVMNGVGCMALTIDVAEHNEKVVPDNDTVEEPYTNIPPPA